jgi:hypothetical protein
VVVVVSSYQLLDFSCTNHLTSQHTRLANGRKEKPGYRRTGSPLYWQRKMVVSVKDATCDDNPPFFDFFLLSTYGIYGYLSISIYLSERRKQCRETKQIEASHQPKLFISRKKIDRGSAG